MNVDEIYLNPLRFADHIISIAYNIQELNEMLQLNDLPSIIDIIINHNKTKIMSQEKVTKPNN